MKKLLVLSCLVANFSFAKTQITKEWLEDKPRSYAKDFYIWRYLNSDITPKEAIWALGEAKNVNDKLFTSYAKRLKHDETSRVVSCQKMSHKKLVKEDALCIELGLSPYKATKLSQQEIKTVQEKLQEKYPKSAKILDIIKSPIAFHILNNSDNETFYNTFLEVGSSFRTQNFNYHLPLKTLNQLRSDTKNFQKLIRKIVLEPSLKKPQESLLHISTDNLNHASTFYLAINAIKHKQYKRALHYLDASSKNAYYMFDKNKVTFWKYQLSLNKKLLEELAKSWDINIYSIYAKEHLNQTFDNAVFEFSKVKEDSTYNIINPFEWLKVLNESKKVDDTAMKRYEQLFNNEATSGHLAFIQERYYNYKQIFFPNPYKPLIQNYSKQRQTLINAIARQESRFIPTSISPSYALGVMQIMPFLSKDIAKDLNVEYDIDRQLEASTNIKYANHHLDYLEKHLKHPLLIAYAYNGGIGFTKRMLKSGIFTKGKFEPYLSMELVPFDESKRYGKKVLANYIMYYNHIHKKKIHLSTELEKLKLPFH